MIWVVTPTRDRPSLALTERWVRRQTVPVKWLVVDDGASRVPIEPDILIEPEPMVADSLRRNMALAFERLAIEDCTAVVVMEDDDWYGPEWCAMVTENLWLHQIVAQHKMLMYHVPTARYRIKSRGFALGSLNTTAFHAMRLSDAIRVLSRVPDEAQVDTELWLALAPPARKIQTDQFVTLKGLPGRARMTYEQRMRIGKWREDHHRRTLRAALGPDADAYLDLCACSS